LHFDKKYMVGESDNRICRVLGETLKGLEVSSNPSTTRKRKNEREREREREKC
jgi:hypothetical protein